MKKKRTYNLRRIKQNYPYSIPDIAELFGIHKHTIGMWIKGGLPLIEKRKPYLIHGSDLFTFLKSRQDKRKQSCQIHELFCLKCQQPRSAWANLADLTLRNAKIADLSALCSVCETSMNKAVSFSMIPLLEKTLIIQMVEGKHYIRLSCSQRETYLRKENHEY